MANRRTADATDYRRWYKLKAWDQLRWRIYQRDAGKCHICGKVVPGDQFDADHVTPHKGDPALFWDESNVKPAHHACHARHKQSEERRGYSKAVGADGWPTDERHPANRGAL